MQQCLQRFVLFNLLFALCGCCFWVHRLKLARYWPSHLHTAMPSVVWAWGLALFSEPVFTRRELFLRSPWTDFLKTSWPELGPWPCGQLSLVIKKASRSLPTALPSSRFNTLVQPLPPSFSTQNRSDQIIPLLKDYSWLCFAYWINSTPHLFPIPNPSAQYRCNVSPRRRCIGF